MREILQKQLDKMDVNYIVDEENHIIHFIKKQSGLFEKCGVYDIEVDDVTLTDKTSLLYTNYNGCSIPPQKELRIEVIDFKGKYMKVNALTKNNKLWSGYLPINKTKIIKEVK